MFGAQCVCFCGHRGVINLFGREREGGYSADSCVSSHRRLMGNKLTTLPAGLFNKFIGLTHL